MRHVLAIAALFAIISLAGAAGAESGADGAKIYQRCAACHLPNGAGVPGAFPALAGRVNDVAQREAGRDYLVMAVAAGIMGEIDIDGARIRGFMPAQTGLTDAEIAAVLNYAAGLQPVDASADASADEFTADEVTEIRARYNGATPNAVHSIRTSAFSNAGDNPPPKDVPTGEAEK